MLISLSFIPHALRIAPLLLLMRAAALLVSSNTRRRTTVLHELGLVGFWLYLSAVILVTVNLARIAQGNFAMGETYNLTPFAEIMSIASSGDRVYALLNIAGNVAMFLPWGFLLPLLWRRWSMGRVFFISLLASGCIETLQFFTGRYADIDDVMLNTLGGVAGFLGYRVFHAVAPKLAAAFRVGSGSGDSQRPLAQQPREEPTRFRETPTAKKTRDKTARPYGKAVLLAVAVFCLWISGAVLRSGFDRLAALTSRSAPSPQVMQYVRPARQISLEISGVNSTAVLLAPADLSQILFGQNVDRRIYPASMTKIMTVILALQSIEDLEEYVDIGADMFSAFYQANLSTAGFQPGESVRAIDLVYGAMLPSGAECSVALAEYVAGSQQAFALLMNQKALELGMDDTHFVNATGNHHKHHYTTAGDMALLLSHALENPVFRTVAATRQYTTAATSLHPEGITFTSTLFDRAGQASFPGGVLVGGKTGYTDEAGQCLASFARIGDREYILVTAGAYPQDYRTEGLHIEDALAVYGALGEYAVLAGVV